MFEDTLKRLGNDIEKAKFSSDFLKILDKLTDLFRDAKSAIKTKDFARLCYFASLSGEKWNYFKDALEEINEKSRVLDYIKYLKAFDGKWFKDVNTLKVSNDVQKLTEAVESLKSINPSLVSVFLQNNFIDDLIINNVKEVNDIIEFVSKSSDVEIPEANEKAKNLMEENEKSKDLIQFSAKIKSLPEDDGSGKQANKKNKLIASYLVEKFENGWEEFLDNFNDKENLFTKKDRKAIDIAIKLLTAPNDKEAEDSINSLKRLDEKFLPLAGLMLFNNKLSRKKSFDIIKSIHEKMPLSKALASLYKNQNEKRKEQKSSSGDKTSDTDNSQLIEKFKKSLEKSNNSADLVDRYLELRQYVKNKNISPKDYQEILSELMSKIASVGFNDFKEKFEESGNKISNSELLRTIDTVVNSSNETDVIDAFGKLKKSTPKLESFIVFNQNDISDDLFDIANPLNDEIKTALKERKAGIKIEDDKEVRQEEQPSEESPEETMEPESSDAKEKEDTSSEDEEPQQPKENNDEEIPSSTNDSDEKPEEQQKEPADSEKTEVPDEKTEEENGSDKNSSKKKISSVDELLEKINKTTFDGFFPVVTEFEDNVKNYDNEETKKILSALILKSTELGTRFDAILSDLKWSDGKGWNIDVPAKDLANAIKILFKSSDEKEINDNITIVKEFDEELADSLLAKNDNINAKDEEKTGDSSEKSEKTSTETEIPSSMPDKEDSGEENLSTDTEPSSETKVNTTNNTETPKTNGDDMPSTTEKQKITSVNTLTPDEFKKVLKDRTDNSVSYEKLGETFVELFPKNEKPISEAEIKIRLKKSDPLDTKAYLGVAILSKPVVIDKWDDFTKTYLSNANIKDTSVEKVVKFIDDCVAKKFAGVGNYADDKVVKEYLDVYPSLWYAYFKNIGETNLKNIKKDNIKSELNKVKNYSDYLPKEMKELPSYKKFVETKTLKKTESPKEEEAPTSEKQPSSFNEPSTEASSETIKSVISDVSPTTLEGIKNVEQAKTDIDDLSKTIDSLQAENENLKKAKEKAEKDFSEAAKRAKEEADKKVAELEKQLEQQKSKAEENLKKAANDAKNNKEEDSTIAKQLEELSKLVKNLSTEKPSETKTSEKFSEELIRDIFRPDISTEELEEIVKTGGDIGKKAKALLDADDDRVSQKRIEEIYKNYVTKSIISKEEKSAFLRRLAGNPRTPTNILNKIIDSKPSEDVKKAAQKSIDIRKGIEKGEDVSSDVSGYSAELSLNQIVGRLHDVAMEAVEGKYGGITKGFKQTALNLWRRLTRQGIRIINSGMITKNGKSIFVGVTNSREYTIEVAPTGIFTSEKAVIDGLKLYLKYFTGEDVDVNANDILQQPKDIFGRSTKIWVYPYRIVYKIYKRGDSFETLLGESAKIFSTKKDNKNVWINENINPFNHSEKLVQENTTEDFVKMVKKGENLKAKQILEKILEEKAKKRVEKVLQDAEK